MIEQTVKFKSIKKQLFAKKPTLVSQTTKMNTILDEAAQQERIQANRALRNQMIENEKRERERRAHKLKFFKALQEIKNYYNKKVIRPAETYSVFLTNLEVRFKVLLFLF